MIRTILFYPALVLSTLIFSSLSLACGWLSLGPAAFDWVNRNWARTILLAAGVKVTVRGIENLGPPGARIIVSNHQSYFDIWAMLDSLPASIRFIAKGELSRIPVLAGGMKSAGHVFIDRRNAKRARASIRQAAGRMRSDALSLVLFPEGTRSPDGEPGRFKRGAFGLAIELGAPLVPAAVDGGHHVFPPGAKRIRPRNVEVSLAPPIDLDGMVAADRNELMRDVRGAIESMLREGREARRSLK